MCSAALKRVCVTILILLGVVTCAGVYYTFFAKPYRVEAFLLLLVWGLYSIRRKVHGTAQGRIDIYTLQQ